MPPQDPNKQPGAAGPDENAGVDENEPDELETDDPDGEDGGDGEEPEWKPPTKQEWDAQQAALEAEKAKLARARKQAERLRKGGGRPADPATGQEGAAPAGSGELDVWKGRAVRAAAKAELLDRGIDADMVGLALAQLKPGEIEFDDEDEPELGDWLDDIQDRYPKLFAPKSAPAPAAERPRAGRVDQGAPAAGRPARPKMSLGEAIIAKSEAARRAGGGRGRI